MGKNSKGKTIVSIIITSIFAAIILSLLGWAYTATLAANVMAGSALGLVLVAVLLWVSYAVRPGKEDVAQLLPVLLVVSAIVGVIAQVWSGSPLSFVVDWSLVGFSLALSSVVFASALTMKVLDNF